MIASILFCLVFPSRFFRISSLSVLSWTPSRNGRQTRQFVSRNPLPASVNRLKKTRISLTFNVVVCVHLILLAIDDNHWMRRCGGRNDTTCSGALIYRDPRGVSPLQE